MKEGQGSGVWPKGGPRPRRVWTGAGVAIALVLMGLLLVLLTEPVPGRAASNLDHNLMPSTSFTIPEVLSATVFLPLVHRQDAAANQWLGEYYDNANLSGEPVYITVEKRVDYDWGKDGSPAGLPDDYFSIRWTGEWDFEYGEYTFMAYADDGMRLWLDGNLVIDSWLPGQGTHEYKTTIQVAGRHQLKLEYFERTGGAAMRLQWRRTDLYPQWKGTYYDQPWVESGKLYEQTDSTIEFDWGEGCPDYLPCDAFSISWVARPVFETGTYRFYIYADEGYQLLVDGDKVKEGGWNDGQSGGSVDTHYDLAVSSVRYHHITFNFHDRGGPAEARLWIQKRGEPDLTAEYYGNKNLSGSPVLTKQEEAIFRDWGMGKPYPGLPSADSFSARWTGQRYFHAGTYRFGLFADDGVRLWVDGELLVDEWHDGRAEYHSPLTFLTSGYHAVLVEYYENLGSAEIRLWWE
jgi:hypothetical protein